jgi:uncharacterized membrane protein YdfJ with MMPL/SSD domain
LARGAVVVVMDATVFRSVVVPANMAVLGNCNWYLLDWLPKLLIESAL